MKQAQFKTYVSQGSSLQGSQLANSVLTKMGQNINQQITKQSINTLEQQHVDVKASDIEGLTNPVNVDSHTVNKVKRPSRWR